MYTGQRRSGNNSLGWFKRKVRKVEINYGIDEVRYRVKAVFTRHPDQVQPMVFHFILQKAELYKVQRYFESAIMRIGANPVDWHLAEMVEEPFPREDMIHRLRPVEDN